MTGREEQFLQKLLATFKVEAEEHLKAISSGLLALEGSVAVESQIGVIETIFREAHSLKGAARSVNAAEAESLCQSLESVLAGMKRREIPLSADLFDLLHQCIEKTGKLVAAIELEGSAGEQAGGAAVVKDLKRRLEVEFVSSRMMQKGTPEGGKAGGAGETPGVEREGDEGRGGLRGSRAEERADGEQLVLAGRSGTLRISTEKLDALWRQGEQLLSAKLATIQRSSELQALYNLLPEWRREWRKVIPEARGISHPRILEFLDWSDRHLQAVESTTASLARSFRSDAHSLAGMVDCLVDDLKRLLMLPFSSLLEIFPRLVRDLSRQQGKEADLLVRGDEIEIDRRILDGMKDPLIHLIRNCVDHGIERPDVRGERTKPPRGKVSITVSQKDSSKVEIVIGDDGAGIDIKKVTLAAVRSGAISEEQAGAFTDEELLLLIFRSGVSTAPLITDLSGRGLGLAIAREKVERLGGAISVESHSGAGSRFRILLPLTLATFRGTMVLVSGRIFVLPNASAERVARVRKDEIHTAENRETIRLNQETLPLVHLGDLLELPRSNGLPAGGLLSIVVLSGGEGRVALWVDQVLQEQEVLVKSLGKQLARVRNVAGATLLGSGKVVPILNPSDLIKSAIAMGAPPLSRLREAEGEKKRKTILVVEDSITARTLLKNLLELAGYSVRTAVDGMEAVTLLKTEGFDLVVSDVDMPRMNGFDLTAKIRADRRLSEIPVVLVTALESREDRERGIDVGANAYIVKSSFDQGNLLEIVHRLI